MWWNDFWANPDAYLPPRSTLWLWVGGPALVLITYFLTMRSDAERRKRLREAEIWRTSVGPERVVADEDNKGGAPFRPDPAKKKATKKRASGPARVKSVPGALQRSAALAAAGETIEVHELVKELAYLVFTEANAASSSNAQTVTARLDEAGPTMTVRPLPRVDGVAVANTGVQFKKDPELMGLFLIEGPEAKAIGKWLSNPIRRALCELPSACLRVEGKTVAVTVFGDLAADQIDALVQLADTIFAEHGAEGGPSLFGEDAGPSDAIPAPAASEKPKKSSKKPAPPVSTSETMNETPVSKRRV